MPTTSRPQQRYDHRLRDLVQRTGELTIATDLGVPRSTARGRLGAAPTVVVSLEGADLTAPELRQEIVKLRRRVEKLAALLRLALALLHTAGFRLSGARLPDGQAKRRILRAVKRARECIPLRAVVRFMRVSPSRFQAWRRSSRRMTVVSMCHISSAPVVRSPTFGFAGCTRRQGRRQPYVRTRRYQVEGDADTVPSRCARTASVPVGM
jgi:hypothetical protein